MIPFKFDRMDLRHLAYAGMALLLALMTVNVCLYAFRVGSPVIRGDDWYYTATIVKSYLEGHLGILDFFTKRDSGENAQPINRLVLLGLVQWYQMDFSAQGLLGALLAAGCTGLLTWFAWRERRPDGQQPWVRPLLPFALGLVILSLNAYGDYGWPLVTALVYTGTLGISIYLYVGAELYERGAWLRLALLAFVLLVVLDTFATLAVLGAVLLMLAKAPGSTRPWRGAGAAVATAAALVIYQRLFAYFTGTANSPLQGHELGQALGYLMQHAGEAWKVLVVPFGASLFAIPSAYGANWPILTTLAVLLWALHAWFWYSFLRRRSERLVFLAAGLMLYFYGTVAGMLVDRIPLHDFDYLFQPRYVAFYQLQLVALILMWSRTGTPRVSMRAYAQAAGAVCGLLLLLNTAATVRVWRSAPSVERYSQHATNQIADMARDPAHPPVDCVPEITACHWPEDQRRDVLGILEKYQLNVFSPAMRARHGYSWPEPPLAPQRVDAVPEKSGD